MMSGAARTGGLASVGLVDGVRGCLFDLDGVLTQTATVHAWAWKEAFDAFLLRRARETGTGFVPFNPVADYDEYVDGKSRDDGVRSFLASRGVTLPEVPRRGLPTVATLGERKNLIFLRRLRRDGVRVYPGSVRYLYELRELGIPCAVVSSSTNCRKVLAAAGIADLFDIRVDGILARRRHLPGKPAPDTYEYAARALMLSPSECAVFEDALAGVEAGRAGRFVQVVGVDRIGQADDLRTHGATVVITDLSDLMVGP